MTLFVQPGDGVKPLVDAIDCAKERVEIIIFRFDRIELEKALIRAVTRGVFVHALIAYTNRGGEKSLRELEMRLLEHGVTVARTADDLVRYHSKVLIVDRRELFVLGFNFTYLDMEHSRSFGVLTKEKPLVQEAIKLFEADTTRQNYQAGSSQFLVSPINSRKELSTFIEGCTKQLLIYDPEISDPRMLRLIEQKTKQGVDVRIIGKVDSKAKVHARILNGMRLHARTMIRDAVDVFNGSQSLRAAELETRREVGLVFPDAKIAKKIIGIFEDDWLHSAEGETTADGIPVQKTARKVAKAIAKSLPPVGHFLEDMVRDASTSLDGLEVDTAKLEEAVKVAVKLAVEQSVLHAVQEAVDEQSDTTT